MKLLLWPMSDTHMKEALDQKLTMFRATRTLKFHKALVNFPTGMEVMRVAAEASHQRTVDATKRNTLEKVLERTTRLATLSTESSLATLLQSKAPFADIFKSFHEVIGSASDAFITTHAATIKKVEDTIGTASMLLTQAAAREDDALLTQVFNSHAAVMTKANEGEHLEQMSPDGPEALKKAVADFRSGVSKPAEVLKDIAKEADIAQAVQATDLKCVVVTAISLTFDTLLAGSALDTTDTNLINLLHHVALPLPCPAFGEIAGREDFARQTTTRLQFMVEAAVMRSTSPLLKLPAAQSLLNFYLYDGIMQVNLGDIDSKGVERQALSMVLSETKVLTQSDLVTCFSLVSHLSENKQFKTVIMTKQMQAQLFILLTPKVLEETVNVWYALDIDIAIDGVEALQVPLWLLFFLPRLLLLVVETLAVGASLKVANDKPDDFAFYLEGVSNFERLQAHLSDIDGKVPKACLPEGNGVIACPKGAKVKAFIDEASHCLTQNRTGFVAAWMDSQRKRNDSLANAMKEDGIPKVLAMIEAGLTGDSASMAELQKIAGSQASRALHSSCKSLDEAVEVQHKIVAIKGLPAAEQQSLNELDFDQVQGRTMNCTLAVVQALMRPLRDQETRMSLARRARLMVASKAEVKLPPNLDMLLSKTAVTGSTSADSVAGSPTKEGGKAAAEAVLASPAKSATAASSAASAQGEAKNKGKTQGKGGSAKRQRVGSGGK